MVPSASAIADVLFIVAVTGDDDEDEMVRVDGEGDFLMPHFGEEDADTILEEDDDEDTASNGGIPVGATSRPSSASTSIMLLLVWLMIADDDDDDEGKGGGGTAPHHVNGAQKNLFRSSAIPTKSIKRLLCDGRLWNI
jgi:hypothetical protein